MHNEEILVAAVFIAFLVAEAIGGTYRKNRRPAGEWLIDGISVAQLPLIKTAVLGLAWALAALLLPQYQGELSGLSTPLAFLLVFLPDDFSHYWLHRLAHEHPRLWGFHRTHHTPGVYQVSIAFRENWLWFWIMPGFWWMGFMAYLGLPDMVLLSTAVIGLHNIWIHSANSGKTATYRQPIGGPLMCAMEWLINTPALHRAHHGLGKNGVPMGNYAQTLFIWDVLFGTATFTRGKLPEAFGTVHTPDMAQPWYYQLWWPIFNKQKSASDDQLAV